jgi:hypothetical protein
MVSKRVCTYRQMRLKQKPSFKHFQKTRQIVFEGFQVFYNLPTRPLHVFLKCMLAKCSANNSSVSGCMMPSTRSCNSRHVSTWTRMRILSRAACTCICVSCECAVCAERSTCASSMCSRLRLHLRSSSRPLFLGGLLDYDLLVFSRLLLRLRLTLHLAGLLLACLGLVAAAAAALACLPPRGKILIEIKVHGGRVALPRPCCGCNSTMRWARRQPVEHALHLAHVRATETKYRSVATARKGKQQEEVSDLDFDNYKGHV